MTLTTAQITTLTSLLPACRKDWDKAGCLTFVSQLAADPRPWPDLIAQAVGQAANSRNLTPKCILDPLPVEAQVRRLPDPPARDPLLGTGSVWCTTHMCNTTVRDDGMNACCWTDTWEPSPPAYLRVGTSNGPSDEARALIEARLGPRRKARDMSGSVGGDETK